MMNIYQEVFIQRLLDRLFKQDMWTQCGWQSLWNKCIISALWHSQEIRCRTFYSPSKIWWIICLRLTWVFPVSGCLAQQTAQSIMNLSVCCHSAPVLLDLRWLIWQLMLTRHSSLLRFPNLRDYKHRGLLEILQSGPVNWVTDRLTDQPTLPSLRPCC